MTDCNYRTIILLLAIFVTSCDLQGQQLQTWSSFYETGFVWNPALTAKSSNRETSVTARREWTGFENSPEYGNISYQYPIVRRKSKYSFGGYVDYDRVGPYHHGSVAGTFAYKTRPMFFGKKRDVLSLGVKVNFNSHRYSPDRLTAFDGFQQDALLKGESLSTFTPNVGVGLFYMSVSDRKLGFQSHYFFGLSFNQLIPSSLSFSDSRKLSQVIHSTMNLGYRYYPSGSPYFVEPGLFVTYGYKKAYNVMTSVKVEYEERFWMTFGAVQNAEIFGQLGFIFNDQSALDWLVNDDILRVGLKVDYSFGEIGAYSGVGYELYVAYLISNEPNN